MREKLIKTGIILLMILTVSGTVAAQSTSNTNLQIKLIKTEPVPLETSEYADIWVKVINKGDKEAENVHVEFVPEFPFEAEPDEKTEWNLGDIVRGEEYHIHFQARVEGNALSGTNDLKFKIGRNDPVITYNVPVEVRTDDEALIIDNIDFPSKVGPGTSNVMEMELKNLADSYLKNIDVSIDLESEDLPFATRDTTRKRIQKIESGDSSSVSFNINVDEDAEKGVYKLPITLEYDNEAGSNFTIEETTGIVVGGRSELEVGINSKDIQVAGSSGTVTFRIVNRGEGRARFVSMELKNSSRYEILSPQEAYIGNMDPDDFQTAEFELFVEETSEDLKIPVILKYKNSEGVSQEEIVEVPINLYTESELDKYRSGGSSFWIYVVVIILLAGAGWWYWKKRG